jgi:hypothetical protein
VSEITGVVDASAGFADPDDVLIGPCYPYAQIEDLPDGCPCRIETSGDLEPSDEALTAVLNGATTIVWSLLGRQPIGLCEQRVFPCLRENNWRWNWYQQQTYTLAPWGGMPACACSGDAVLLEGPVNDIIEVVVDGEILERDEYVLVDGQWLDRVDGSWPAGGRAGDEAAFAITYLRGIPVDTLVRDATIEVANVLWMDRCGVANCLPGRAVTSMSQAGTGYSYQGDQDRVREAGEALGTLWRAIGVYNPGQVHTPTMVFSPDEPYRTRTIRAFS